jgi:LysM repeat protein
MRDDWRRYAAPAAFLLAVTVAVVLIRAGMNSGNAPHVATTVAPAPHKTVDVATTTTAKTKKKAKAAKRYWTVQAGDTFEVISSRTGVPVATIEQLNPTVKSTSLFIGEKLRLE